MAQGAEASGGGIIKGDGADARDPLAQINAQSGPIGRHGRLHPDPGLPPVPADHQVHIPVGAVQGVADILGAVDGAAVDGQDLVPDPQPRRLPRGQRTVEGGHGDTVPPQLQADDLPHRHQHPGSPDRHREGQEQ